LIGTKLAYFDEANSLAMEENTPPIRQALLADAAAMKVCVEAAYRHYISRIGQIPGPMLEDYSEVVQKHQAFMTEAKGQIVGVLVLIRKDSGILLDNVAVHPEHQGKGLGRRLIELAESEARDQGFAHLDLYTNERMTENIARYKRLGYLETERRIEKGYNRIYMRKSLSGNYI
jgi:ribosomal protein S18 acetylase RimI-like enzyme